MPRPSRVAVCALVLVAATGCTSGKKKSPPSAAPSASPTAAGSETTAPASASAAASSGPSASATSSPPASVSSSPVATATPSPSPTTTATAPAVPADPPPAPTAAGSGSAGAAQLAAARALLVTGPKLGGDWMHLPEEEHELGDVCGTATAAEKDRLFEVSWELANPNYEAGGRHGIGRYKPGGAGAAARTILDLLAKCRNVTQEFDGASAVVNVTPQTPNMATFTITFASGGVSHGGIAVTNTAEYLSLSTSYGETAPLAAELAGEMDLRAKDNFKDAGLQ